MNELEYEIYNDKIVYIKNVIPNSKEIIEALESNKNEIITDWIYWGNKYYTSLEQKKATLRIHMVLLNACIVHFMIVKKNIQTYIGFMSQ